MCDVCDQPIRPREVEHQVSIESVGVFRSHQRCFAVWDRERAWYLTWKNKPPFEAGGPPS
jgi:hypothetical protein